jgi:hypothetical protein
MQRAFQRERCYDIHRFGRCALGIKRHRINRQQIQGSKEENSKISEHIYRTGYHFRESIVDEARGAVGETIISVAADISRNAEPIPESQDEINKQADAAIRDLFPRIPNTDRQMIIEHAFQKVWPT